MTARTRHSVMRIFPLVPLVLFSFIAPTTRAFFFPSTTTRRHHFYHRRTHLNASFKKNALSKKKAGSSNINLNRNAKLKSNRKNQTTQKKKNSESSFLFNPKSLIKRADATRSNTRTSQRNDEEDDSSTTRRLFLASGLLLAGGLVGQSSLLDAPPHPMSIAPPPSLYADSNSRLQWEITPVNKRTGVTVFDAERAGYNVRFVTYLSRFLLTFDGDCQRWWYNRAADLPRLRATAEEVTQQRYAQFAAFAASVEVGLQEFQGGKEGPTRLLQSLVQRYCPDRDTIRSEREQRGLPPLSEAVEQRQEREIKEARRQIALLFSLMEKNQPYEEITKLLAAIDNGSISEVEIVDRGSGYAPGYGSPEVRFPEPEAGEGYERAQGRAILGPNGKILRIDLVNRGFGYKQPPTVTISAPAALRFGDDDEKAVNAEAKAFVFKNGRNKGRLERVELTNPGAGYTKNEIIRIRFSPPDLFPSEGGVQATAAAVLEYEVVGIEMLKNGTGYAVEKPIDVFVEPPPLTARVNMNDPMMARVIAPDEPLPATTIPSRDMRQRMLDPSDPNSVAAKASFMAVNGGIGGGGGCIGRACYDRPVIAIAYPVAEKSSYTAFQKEEDALKPQQIEMAATQSRRRVVSGSISGKDGAPPEPLPLAGGSPSSSSELLKLLPAGVGLEFDRGLQRYVLAIDPDFNEKLPDLSKRAFDPDFGPRGRSPIERDMELGVSSYLRFIASGAICCSGVHLAVTPLDVTKTRMQTNPKEYPGAIRAFKKVLADGGPSSFFTGAGSTFVGWFCWGGISYALTEYVRRTLTATAGLEAANYEVPIILFAAAVGAFVGCFVISPFEAARIRSVAQPGYGKNMFDVFDRLIREEGTFSLFKAVPVFWAKEIPFAMGKFTVFDVSTSWMYTAFPAAREDLQLSLAVSLLGGTLGGMVAAVLSNPADITISELKKTKSDMTAMDAVNVIVDRDGVSGLFRGLPLRLAFYSFVVSLQFLVYDSVRFALGIGSDDLKMYLDVLGGALSESGGPV